MKRSSEASGRLQIVVPGCNPEISVAYLKGTKMMMRNEIEEWRVAHLPTFAAIAAQLRKEAAHHVDDARPCLRLAAHFDELSHEMGLAPEDADY